MQAKRTLILLIRILCISYLVTLITGSIIPQDNRPSSSDANIGSAIRFNAHEERQRQLIVGGIESVPGRYPYMASIASLGSHRCGGTLVAPDIILTAGHCAGSVYEIRLGLDNIDNYTEYESYIIEDSILHPRSKANRQVSTGVTDPNLDEYDFFLIKFFGRSERVPIILNTDPSIPNVTGENVLVAGWGVTDFEDYDLSPVLREVVLQYLTNEDCSDIKYTLPNGEVVDFRTRVINVTICASSSEEKDACSGDSGGPIMINNPTFENNQDVQIGLVSYGVFGCGVPNLPGVYARVSHVAEWIQESICQLSNDPPARFGCSTKKTIVSDELANITIQIGLDFFPAENGWILQSENEDGVWMTYANRPIFSFADRDPFEVLAESIQVPINRQYRFTMLDRKGDGMCCKGFYGTGNGNLTILEGTNNIPSTILLRTTLLEFDYSISFMFILGTLPSLSPTATAAPSITHTALVSSPFLSIEIRFDDFPSESGWELDVLDPNGTVTMIANKYAGTYANETSKSIYVQQVILSKEYTAPNTTFRFIATDTSTDGICCRSGFGFYRVWYGDPETGILLAEIGRFYIEEYVDFRITALDPTFSPSSLLTTSGSHRIAPWMVLNAVSIWLVYVSRIF